MEKELLDLINKINETLVKINVREETKELFSESNKLIEKSDKRVENSLNQIQNSFDRIHDKAFNFNNILIGVFMVLGTFPNDEPKLKIWTVVFPLLNLIYIVYIDFRQMEIHRFASREQEWNNVEREKFGNMINIQTKLSLIALLFSILFLVW